jgi:general secretion pathway protein A
MYQQFFGLQKEPFAMTPDPALLFLTPGHREALAGLTYAVLSRKGFVVLTGDPGTGKTTLLTQVFHSIPTGRAQFSVILNPTLTPSEFLEMALLDFGINNVPVSKAQRLTLLQEFLIDVFQNGQTAALVVDEAHKLSTEVLEEIRLLGNFERADGKLLQIVLAGQAELGDILNRQDMRQLKQRVAVRLTVQPLSALEVDQYVKHRWLKAGAGKPHPFQPEAIASIGQYSQGIPRLVNALCDNALALAWRQNRTTVNVPQISEAARNLDLTESSTGRARWAHVVSAPEAARVANGIDGTAAATMPPGAFLTNLGGYQTIAHKSSTLSRLAGRLRLSKA